VGEVVRGWGSGVTLSGLRVWMVFNAKQQKQQSSKDELKYQLSGQKTQRPLSGRKA